LPDPLPEPAPGDQAGLQDLDEPGRDLLGGQGLQHGGVRENGNRLVIDTHVVLRGGQVDARLATVGRVDLGDQGGGRLDQGNAALVGGGAEPRQVTDDAPAEGQHAVVAPGARRCQLAEHPLGLRDRLRRLGALDCDGRLAGRQQPCVSLEDGLVGNAERPGRQGFGERFPGGLEQADRPLADRGRVGSALRFRPGHPDGGRALHGREPRRGGLGGVPCLRGQDCAGERLIEGAAPGETS
jgi:hypothetical protein